MAGRPRLPTQIKLVKGTHQKTRDAANEPQPAPGAPAQPTTLSPEAASAWPGLCSTFSHMGILTQADGWALQELAETYALLVRLRRDQAAKTYQTLVETTGRDGNVMIRACPLQGQVSDASRHLMSILAQFGATPAARSRVSANAALGQANPYADLDGDLVD